MPLTLIGTLWGCFVTGVLVGMWIKGRGLL